MPDQDEFLYSPVVSQTATATFGVGSNLTWDSFWHKVYDDANKVIQRQANELLKRGNLVEAEVRALVEGQSNPSRTVLTSVGKSRAVVNRFAAVSRVASGQAAPAYQRWPHRAWYFPSWAR